MLAQRNKKMRKIIQFICFFLTVTLCSYAQGIEIKATCSHGILLSAVVDPEVVDFRFWENFSMFKSSPHINASLRVINASGASASFSNKNALLSVNSLSPSRAYINSIASKSVDSGNVWLEPRPNFGYKNLLACSAQNRN